MLLSSRWVHRIGAPHRQIQLFRWRSCAAYRELSLTGKWHALAGPAIFGVLRSPRQLQTKHIASLSFQDETIFALSTATGRAGIAIIRISGAASVAVFKKLCPGKALPKPRYAAVRTLLDPRTPDNSNVLDPNALVLYFPSPKTVTGEDVLELHVHGGPATVKAVLSAISACSGKSPIRYAEPGEFTRRAFLNARLDLAQVEALSDTLAAETEQQRRAAVRGSSGALGRTYDGWRQELLLARGEIEALIDFSEDQHFDESPTELLSSVTRQVKHILAQIQVHEGASQRSELLRKGIRIALLGPPNVGKSSLMNLIVGREASIVSTEAGTTRDIIEASLDIRGYLCSFADTAGFRASQLSTNIPSQAIGAIEMEGIRRARQKALDSDIIIVLASVELDGDGTPRIQYDAETMQLAANASSFLVSINKRDAVSPEVFSRLSAGFKQDVMGQIPGLDAAEPLPLSCKEAQMGSTAQKDSGGVQTLIDRLVQAFSSMTSLPDELLDLFGVTERQRQLLVQCRTHLEDFVAEAQPSEEGVEADIVLAAEHLRYAAICLARITGRGEFGDVEEVLGVIFEKFCVGK